MHTNKLAILVDQWSKTIQKKEKDKATKAMILQFQQLSNQVRPSRRPFLQGNRRACYHCNKPGHLKKDCRKLKGHLEKEKKQKQA